jgi:sugar phosphate isomerase/epimerase
MSYLFRYSVCNELYERRVFPDVCKAVRKAGYTGLEIAPFTLSEDPASIPPAKRREYAETMKAEGLEFVGLHWLLVAPKGLHATTPDKGVRERTWDYLHKLVDLCADLGPSGVMVFGSPKQRAATGGMTPADATRVLADGLAAMAPHASERGVTVLLEALPVPDSDVVNSLDEAAAIVGQINHPGLRTMFDTHNAVNEREPHQVLVERHFELIRHVHVNEMDGRHPGTGSYDFKPVMAALGLRGYSGWVSLEVFDFSAGADKIARDSLSFLQAEVQKLQ